MVVLGALVDMRRAEKEPGRSMAGRRRRHLFAVEIRKKERERHLVLPSFPQDHTTPYLGLVKPPVFQELEEREARGRLEEDEHFCWMERKEKEGWRSKKRRTAKE